MLKNAGHIILAVQALTSHWRHYNLDSCFDGIKEVIHIPPNYDYVYQGFCTPESEYKVDITKLLDQHSGFTITKNGKILLIINGHPNYFHNMSKIFPEYSILNASAKSVIYKSNEQISSYYPTEYTLEDYLEEDEHFQELMLYDMVQHQDISKICTIRNDCYEIMKNNNYSILLNHSALDDVYDLKNTEIKDSILDTIEEVFPDFKKNYNKAKTNNTVYFNGIYNNI